MNSLIIGQGGKVQVVGFPQNGVVKGSNAEQVLMQHYWKGKYLNLNKVQLYQYVDFGDVTNGKCSRDFYLCEEGDIQI